MQRSRTALRYPPLVEHLIEHHACCYAEIERITLAHRWNAHQLIAAKVRRLGRFPIAEMMAPVVQHKRHITLVVSPMLPIKNNLYQKG